MSEEMGHPPAQHQGATRQIRGSEIQCPPHGRVPSVVLGLHRGNAPAESNEQARQVAVWGAGSGTAKKSRD